MSFIGTSNPVLQLAALATDLSGVTTQLDAIAASIAQQNDAALANQPTLMAQVQTIQAQTAAHTITIASLLEQVEALSSTPSS